MLLFSCSKKQRENLIEPEIEPYVDSFYLEANRLGVELDIKKNDITITFVESDEFSGQCSYGFWNNSIQIDLGFWEDATHERKYWLIFHELGHCVLNRTEHLNEVFPNGECKSEMDGDEDNFFCSSNKYSKLWKNYYINELFFPSRNKLPDWYEKDAIPKPIEAELPVFQIKDGNSTMDTLFTVRNPIDTLHKNYQIHFQIRKWDRYDHFSFEFGDYKWFFNRFWTNQLFRIEDNVSSGGRAIFTQNKLTPNDVEVVQIERRNNFFYFFMDSKLVHIMEYQSPENDIIKIEPRNKEVRFDLKFYVFD